MKLFAFLLLAIGGTGLVLLALPLPPQIRFPVYDALVQRDEPVSIPVPKLEGTYPVWIVLDDRKHDLAAEPFELPFDGEPNARLSGNEPTETSFTFQQPWTVYNGNELNLMAIAGHSAPGDRVIILDLSHCRSLPAQFRLGVADAVHRSIGEAYARVALARVRLPAGIISGLIFLLGLALLRRKAA